MNNFLYLLISILFISGCSNNNFIEAKNLPNFKNITFDVVEKKIEINTPLPDNTDKYLKFWFENKVKLNGFDGSLKFTLDKYKETVSNLSNGKRIDINMSFSIYIEKTKSSSTKLIQGEVTSYGILQGKFTLKEFDLVIKNTQIDLIKTLSQELVSKI